MAHRILRKIVLLMIAVSLFLVPKAALSDPSQPVVVNRWVNVEFDLHDVEIGPQFNGVIEVEVSPVAVILPVWAAGEAGVANPWNSSTGWTWQNGAVNWLIITYSIVKTIRDFVEGDGAPVTYSLGTRQWKPFYNDIVQGFVERGPTERSVDFPWSVPVDVYDVGVGKVSFGAQIKYDVFINDDRIVYLDQNAKVHTLTIGESGSLLIDDEHALTVDEFISNAGSFSKLGLGQTAFSAPFYNSGTLDVLGGSIEFSSGGRGGGIFRPHLGSHLRYCGGYTLTDGAQMTGSGLHVIPGTHALTVAGNIALTSDMRILSSGQIVVPRVSVFTNSGTIVQSGDAVVTMEGYRSYGSGSSYPAEIHNLPGGIYDLQGDGGILLGGSSSGYVQSDSNHIHNAGTFRKSSGTGESVIEASFENTGTVEVTSGTLVLDGGGSSTGGLVSLSNGSRLRIQGGLHVREDNTVSGSGTFEIQEGGFSAEAGSRTTITDGTELLVSGSTLMTDSDAVLSLQPNASGRLAGGKLGGAGTITIAGPFEWTGGEISGSAVTNVAPSFVISTADQKRIRANADLYNSGVIVQSGDAVVALGGYQSYGSGNLYPAEIHNLAGGVYDLQGDGGISLRGSSSGYVRSATNHVNNAGTFRKSSGTGESVIKASFENTGTVEVTSGTLVLDGGVTQHIGNVLTNGTWIVEGDASLNITTGSSIVTNGGNVVLDGPGSRFDKINVLADNQGGFSILRGRNFTTSGDLINGGTITVGHTSRLIVNGQFTMEPGSRYVSRVGSAGVVDVSGQLDLSAAGDALLLEWMPGNDPSSKFGGDYVVATYGTRVGEFNTVGGGDDPYNIGEAYVADVDYETGNQIAVSLHPLLDGDVNFDGLVGLIDWDTFRSNFGASETDWTAGNFDPWDNSMVDLDDWDKFRNNFGKTVPAAEPAAMNVPEPAALVMLLSVGLSGVGVLVRRRRQAAD